MRCSGALTQRSTGGNERWLALYSKKVEGGLVSPPNPDASCVLRTSSWYFALSPSHRPSRPPLSTHLLSWVLWLKVIHSSSPPTLNKMPNTTEFSRSSSTVPRHTCTRTGARTRYLLPGRCTRVYLYDLLAAKIADAFSSAAVHLCLSWAGLLSICVYLHSYALPTGRPRLTSTCAVLNSIIELVCVLLIFGSECAMQSASGT